MQRWAVNDATGGESRFYCRIGYATSHASGARSAHERRRVIASSKPAITPSNFSGRSLAGIPHSGDTVKKLTAMTGRNKCRAILSPPASDQNTSHDLGARARPVPLFPCGTSHPSGSRCWPPVSHGCCTSCRTRSSASCRRHRGTRHSAGACRDRRERRRSCMMETFRRFHGGPHKIVEGTSFSLNFQVGSRDQYGNSN
jgi:hypothetical protein